MKTMFAGRVMEVEVPGHRKRGQPKCRWKYKVKEDMQEKNVNEHKMRDRHEWKR